MRSTATIYDFIDSDHKDEEDEMLTGFMPSYLHNEMEIQEQSLQFNAEGPRVKTCT